MPIMNLLVCNAIMLLGGGVFGAAATDTVHALLQVEPDNALAPPVGSGALAGLGLAILLVGVLSRRR